MNYLNIIITIIIIMSLFFVTAVMSFYRPSYVRDNIFFFFMREYVRDNIKTYVNRKSASHATILQ